MGESDDTNRNVAASSDEDYIAFQFTWSPATNTNLKKMQMKLAEVGDVSGFTYTLEIYNDDGGNDPDETNKVANATCTFSGSAVGGTAAYVGCTTSSAFTLTNGNSYHVVIDRGGTNGTNYVNARYENTSTGGQHLNKSDGTGSPWTWNALDFTTDVSLKIFEGDGC